MAGEKFLKHTGTGGLIETISTQTGGAGNEEKIPSLDAAGRLDTTMMPTGIAADTQSIVTSENLAAGDLVNIYNNAGTPTARKADASAAGREANGFVIASSTAPAAALIYFEGNNESVTGLTAGNVFLSTTAGLTTNAAPVATGNVVQLVGIATAATAMNFERGRGVVLA